jgi:hypothetical protein
VAVALALVAFEAERLQQMVELLGVTRQLGRRRGGLL